MHAGDELTRRERLRDVVVGAQLEARDAVDLLVARRQHQHGEPRAGADGAADVEARRCRAAGGRGSRAARRAARALRALPCPAPPRRRGSRRARGTRGRPRRCPPRPRSRGSCRPSARQALPGASTRTTRAAAARRRGRPGRACRGGARAAPDDLARSPHARLGTRGRIRTVPASLRTTSARGRIRTSRPISTPLLDAPEGPDHDRRPVPRRHRLGDVAAKDRRRASLGWPFSRTRVAGPTAIVTSVPSSARRTTWPARPTGRSRARRHGLPPRPATRQRAPHAATTSTSSAFTPGSFTARR